MAPVKFGMGQSVARKEDDAVVARSWPLHRRPFAAGGASCPGAALAACPRALQDGYQARARFAGRCSHHHGRGHRQPRHAALPAALSAAGTNSGRRFIRCCRRTRPSRRRRRGLRGRRDGRPGARCDRGHRGQLGGRCRPPSVMQSAVAKGAPQVWARHPNNVLYDVPISATRRPARAPPSRKRMRSPKSRSSIRASSPTTWKRARRSANTTPSAIT